MPTTVGIRWGRPPPRAPEAERPGSEVSPPAASARPTKPSRVVALRCNHHYTAVNRPGHGRLTDGEEVVDLAGGVCCHLHVAARYHRGQRRAPADRTRS